ncbi:MULTISPECIES: lasso peptide biosynthesis B2 protein [unclassified Deinococcus]|uniref:lasso peptide biosynthesis B2 protein n=1 Tax=unclassified Deinococcus TaxID=2623546 RepID=UPI001C3115CB|nr:lasso peptide biosynthesis B2 protein [Deinococcus sp. 43]MDK2014349.1 lasso peptide biosynthesis B2 protein [Deinococcus sp. 43]
MARARVIELRRVKGVCVALPVAWRVRRALRRDPDLPRLLRSLERGPSTRCPCPPQELAWTVRTALRVLGVRDRGCVPAAMTLYALLSRQGSPASYVSGVRRVDGRLDGHAWVEIQGVPVAEGDLSGFTELFRFDSGHLV